MTDVKQETRPPAAISNDEDISFVNIDEIDVGVNEQPLGIVGNEVEIYSEHNPQRVIVEQTIPQMIETLFYSKLTLQERTFTTTSADVAINICAPNILDGYMFFDELHALAGPRLMRDCKNYIGMQHGSCRVTRAYNAQNFKCIIHTTLPSDLSNRNKLDVELAQTAIRRCLNEAVARGATSIAFPSYFPAFTPITSIEFVLKVISNWMYLTEQKKALGKLREIQILCHSPTVYRIYRGMIRKLIYDLYDAVNINGGSSLFDVFSVVLRSNRKRRYRSVPYEPYPTSSSANYDYDVDRRQRRRARTSSEYAAGEPVQVQLELSAKLQPSVLILDDKDGLKRQYRLTNKSKDGRKLYFRCSYCDTLIKKTGEKVRAKITLQDGRIVGDAFPEHHPDCKAKNTEEIMVQQIDRKSRREVKEGRMRPREAYDKALELAMQYNYQMSMNSSGGSSSGRAGNSMSDDGGINNSKSSHNVDQPTLPKFPEWQRIRQQYFRMRKVGERLKNDTLKQREQLMKNATYIIKEDNEELEVDVDVDEMV